MDTGTRARYVAWAEIIKALAHPTRLFMVEELAKGTRCVCELTSMVGADTSTVSKHLAILKHVGIVHDEKRGTQVYYNLQCPCVLNFIACVNTVLKSNVERQLELVKE